LYLTLILMNLNNGYLALSRSFGKYLVTNLESKAKQAKYLDRYFVPFKNLLKLDDIAFEIFSFVRGEQIYFSNLLKNIYLLFVKNGVFGNDIVRQMFREIIGAYSRYINFDDLIEFISSDVTEFTMLPPIRSRPLQSRLTDQIVKIRLLDMGENDFIEVYAMDLTKSPVLMDLIRNSSSDVIVIPNITLATMLKVIQFCQYESINPEAFEAPLDELNESMRQFVDIEQSELFELIMAANYLDIKTLLDVSSKAAADMIRGRSTEEIRIMFNIKNDFTPEEEEQIERENSWIMEE